MLGAVGAAPHGPSCPEFHALNPWTQRFLDEEHGARERVFLQNHLMACDHCRAALNRCRELYYEVEKRVPRVDGQALHGIEELGRIVGDLRRRRDPMLWTWKDAVAAFIRRPEGQLLVSVVLAIACWWILGALR